MLPAAKTGDKFLLAIGLPVAPRLLSHRVTIRTESSDDAALSLPLAADDDPGPAWRRYTNGLADQLDKARRDHPPADDYPAAANPPRCREFSLFADPGSYSSVHADLRGIGRHCLVYVDCDYPDPKGLQPAVDEVVRVFDDAVFPAARAEQGRSCLDVDRDGRFAVLFSGRLARMTGGKAAR